MKYWVMIEDQHARATGQDCAIDGPCAGAICVDANSKEEAIEKARPQMSIMYVIVGVRNESGDL